MDQKKRKLLLRIGCGIVAGIFILSLTASLVLQVAMMM